MKSGIVYLCFSTDFFIEEADEWRNDCWKMIKERQDCCTIENQKNADLKLSTFKELPIKHKCITAQPLIMWYKFYKRWKTI